MGKKMNNVVKQDIELIRRIGYFAFRSFVFNQFHKIGFAEKYAQGYVVHILVHYLRSIA
jgi:hypothetical protein